MYRIATVTFHHAYNFGSALQTYALQETVKALAREDGVQIDYRIIDLYSETQERLYSIYKPANSLSNLVKNTVAACYHRQLECRQEKFEAFLQDRCTLTRRYKTREELAEDCPQADCYISGSDQIWNVRAADFSDAYYFSFLPEACKRISYGASLGPLPICWEQYDGEKLRALLQKYTAISVREQGSLENIRRICDAPCRIHVDPTLLVERTQWRSIQSDADYHNGEYILLYCLEPTRRQLKMAGQIARKLGLPVLTLRYNNKNDIVNGFVKRYDAGPEDFLSYIDHAKLVLTSSFHGTAFSMIYEKPFYVLDGQKDNRIRPLLEKTHLEERSLEGGVPEQISLEPPSFDGARAFIESQRQESRQYLKEAIGWQ